MDLTIPPELEDLTICSCCHFPFNDTDAVPKLFKCRHYFCLKCVNSLMEEGSDEIYCIHCWKRTELQGPEPKSEMLPTYKAILYIMQNFNTYSVKSSSTNVCSNGNAININNYCNNTNTTDKQRSSSTTPNCLLNGHNGCCNTNTNKHNIGNSNFSSSINPRDKVDKIKRSENCMTHAMPNTLWCSVCNILLCRACATTDEHRLHPVKNQIETKECLRLNISNEIMHMQKTLNDAQHLVFKQRDFLLKILEGCTTLKTQIETELINHIPTLEISEMRERVTKARLCLEMIDKQATHETAKYHKTLNDEKLRLVAKYQEMLLQCKLDDMIKNYGFVLDFDFIKQALMQLHNCIINGNNIEHYNTNINATTVIHNPVLLLANYCISQLYSKHILMLKQQQQQQQQQQIQQNQQQQMINNSVIRGNAPNGNFTNATYAQALQQEHHKPIPLSLPQKQNHNNNNNNKSKSNQKVFIDSVSSPNSKANFSSNNSPNGDGVSEIAPIGTPASTTSCDSTTQLFPVDGDFNGFNLNILQLHNQNQISLSPPIQQQPSTFILNPSIHIYPIYFFNIEISGHSIGRILIEVRSDVAPKMAKNFNSLVTHELGFGYKGCQIFQCWENESIITGDFDLNNGRGGRSVYDEAFFMPDDTKILAIRGSVGMRRSQKRHDNLGLVGSQFRIILREMRGFTAIFAFVIDGLDLIEQISRTGDTAGKPRSTVVITNCGKYLG